MEKVCEIVLEHFDETMFLFRQAYKKSADVV